MSDDPVSVLLVDDRPAQRLALASVLGQLDVTVVQAASGHAALRCLLQQEFAVILLDVNMPGMDGFETAGLIRQRKSCEDTPIIFITAYADDTHPSRCYSLGAVDYILTPVAPEVLRTKVGVFVELYKRTAEVRRHAAALRRRAAQLQELALASLTINATRSIEDLQEIGTRTAATIIGARQAATSVWLEHDGSRVGSLVTHSDAYGTWRGKHAADLAEADAAAIGPTLVVGRMTQAELEAHGDARLLRRHLSGDLPLRGWMAASLTGSDGAVFGQIQLSDKVDGEFSADDEVILVQLAQMVSIAIENTLHHRAREANRIKDEFLGTLSHELRTPLQVMLTWVRILGRDQLDPAMLRRGLDVLERSIRSQQQLIDDLLDVSRIILNKVRLTVAPLNLPVAIETAVDAIRPAAAEKQIDIETILPEDCPIVGDPTRLQQIVWNLLSNAVKFTPPKGRVQIRLESVGRCARIQVRDDGEGISQDFLPHLFERFRQADSSSTRSHAGLGLGLAIVRHLVDLHGGTVTAESKGKNMGATFTVEIPLPHALPAQPPAGQAAPDRPAAAAAAGGGTRLDGVQIIIVDDEPDTLDCLAATLRQCGACVTTVGSAAAVLAAFDRHIPHVLLSDIGMPEEDGYSLIRKLRARPAERGGRVPAAALTAYVRSEERTRVLSAGFDAHIEKPVAPEELARIVGQLVGHGRDATDETPRHGVRH